MKYHFIGVAGLGMSGVAKLILDAGHTVTGSDSAHVYPPASDYLEEHTISYVFPYARKNIPHDVDCIVIGKSAGLVPETNDEVAYAYELKEKGVNVFSFPEVLNILTKNKTESIVVAGSFGKSTCSALIAWCLQSSGVDTGYFIGASTKTPKVNVAIGSTNHFVFEGDEYPTSNWDNRPKFLHYHPRYVFLTALAHDHINIYPTHEEYIAQFKSLIDILPDDGMCFVCIDDETNRKTTWFTHAVTYGFSTDADYVGSYVSQGVKNIITITHKGETLGTFETSLLGKHNAQNIIGCVSFLLHTKKITIQQAQHAVATFEALTRRLDLKSKKTRIPIYEGFGSSDEKTRSAVYAMKEHFPDKKLFVVFEPHTFSWRDPNAVHWYDTSFEGAHAVYVYTDPTHHLTGQKLSLEEIVHRIQKTNIISFGFRETEPMISTLTREIGDDSVVLFLSSGALGGCIPQCVAIIEKMFPI